MSSDDYLFDNLEQPSLFWRTASNQTLLTVGALCRGFLFGLNKTEVHGLDRFLDLLKSRADYRDRRKGLLTVSNHLCVLDDPLIWGVLPLSFTAFHLHNNHRWSLASHDIAFKSVWASHFFTLGRTLPIHRLAHSPHGGPFQATMTEGIRLFSRITTSLPTYNSFNFIDGQRKASWPRDCVDPFSDIPRAPPAYPSYQNDVRHYFAPSRYASNSYSWIHVFPEGMIHQSPDRTMRYFKWGFTRLILEPPECPDFVPMFIEGTDQVMHESRTWPRFIPRGGKHVTVTFGDAVDTEAVFGDLRRRWRELQCELNLKLGGEDPEKVTEEGKIMTLGIIPNFIGEDPKVQELRMECARRVREEVLKVRRQRGYPDEDPKASYAETWAREGPKRVGEMEDGTWVGNT